MVVTKSSKDGKVLKSSGDVLDDDASEREREKERRPPPMDPHSYVTVFDVEATYVPVRFGVMKLSDA